MDPRDPAVPELLSRGRIEITGRIVDASNATLFGTVSADGLSADCVYKPVRGERPLWDFPDGTLAGREVGSFLVSEAAGFHVVPHTVYREGPFGPGMVQIWVDTDDERELVDVCSPKKVPPGWLGVLRARGSRGEPAVLVHADTPALRRMAAFDVVVNNADRKGGHVLAGVDGHLYGVDHGLTLHVEDKLRTVLWGWVGQPLPDDVVEGLEKLRAELDGAFCDVLGEHVTRREVRTLSARVDALLGRPPLPRAVRLRARDSLARLLTLVLTAPLGEPRRQGGHRLERHDDVAERQGGRAVAVHLHPYVLQVVAARPGRDPPRWRRARASGRSARWPPPAADGRPPALRTSPPPATAATPRAAAARTTASGCAASTRSGRPRRDRPVVAVEAVELAGPVRQLAVGQPQPGGDGDRRVDDVAVQVEAQVRQVRLDVERPDRRAVRLRSPSSSTRADRSASRGGRGARGVRVRHPDVGAGRDLLGQRGPALAGLALAERCEPEVAVVADRLAVAQQHHLVSRVSVTTSRYGGRGRMRDRRVPPSGTGTSERSRARLGRRRSARARASGGDST